jgi:hypothetical protein
MKTSGGIEKLCDLVIGQFRSHSIPGPVPKLQANCPITQFQDSLFYPTGAASAGTARS